MNKKDRLKARAFDKKHGLPKGTSESLIAQLKNLQFPKKEIHK